MRMDCRSKRELAYSLGRYPDVISCHMYVVKEMLVFGVVDVDVVVAEFVSWGVFLWGTLEGGSFWHRFGASQFGLGGTENV